MEEKLYITKLTTKMNSIKPIPFSLQYRKSNGQEKLSFKVLNLDLALIFGFMLKR